MFNVVLWEPEIPPNTGNIARLCAALDLPLHLVGPLGFSVSDRRVRRAGLDYWENVQLHHHPNRAAFEAAHREALQAAHREAVETAVQGTLEAALPAQPAAWYITTKGRTDYWDAAFRPGDYLFFGSETRGLPADLRDRDPERCLVIPHGPNVRSLNLSNAVAIVVYEALRQNRAPVTR